MLLRWKDKHFDEMENGVWFEPIRSFSRRKCDKEWTQEKKIRARPWVIGGAVTQDAICKYGWVESNERKLRDGPGRERERNCKG